MRTIVGMLLGCLMTVGAAYLHDSMTSAGPGQTHDTLVNWDVAARKWGDLKEAVGMTRLNLEFLERSASAADSV